MSEPASRASVVAPSGTGSVVAAVSSGVVSESFEGTISRLELPKRQSLTGEKTFLPKGDVLPKWYNMSLIQKLPMFPSPQGALQLTTTKMGKQPYFNTKRVDFDLTDPCNYCIDNHYKCANDPHMIYYLSVPRNRKRLIKIGELTPDLRATCTLGEFNHYRRWLKHVGLQEFRKQQIEEREKERNMKKMDPGDNLEIAVIEVQIHQEEVRQRQIQQSEVQQIKRRDQMLDMEKRVEAAKIQREERNAPDHEYNLAKKAHRSLVYTKATSLQRKRHRQRLRAYKKKLRRHLEHLKDVEAERVDDTAEKILQGWTRQKDYQMTYEKDVRASFEKEEDRALRYRKLFDAEMNRRWQKQAGQLKKRRDLARERHQDLEEVYSRNLARAFACSPIINPAGYRNVPALEAPPPKAIKATGEAVEDKEKEMETSAEKEEQQSASMEVPHRESVRPTRDRIPSLKSVHLDKTKGSLTIEKPLQAMDVNVRLHSLKDQKSMEEVHRIKGAYAESMKRVSGLSLGRFPGLKKKAMKALPPPSYPIKSKVLGPDDGTPAPGDEVDIYMPYELRLQSLPGDPDDDLLSRKSRDVVTVQQPLVEVTERRRATICEGMSNEEREAMEELLTRLLKDLNEGHLDQDDLVRLAAICAALSESELIEEATSTSLFDYVPKAVSDHGKKTPDSSSSAEIDKYIDETWGRAVKEGNEQEDLFGDSFVEDTIRNTFRQMAEDLEDGTLSREDVREIGSAVASAIMGEVRSDTSVMADEVMVPTLEQLLRDAEDIDEILLDQTMASLLSTYNRVSRRHDKMVWQVLKDFVVEVLLRTKSGMIKGVVDIPNFLAVMETCRVTPLDFEMELPSQKEFLLVMTEAISKLAAVPRLSRVVCELMKIILDQGQPLLVQRHGAERLALPRISTSMLDQVGDTACGLEVALEVAATVADGLYRDLLIEGKFEKQLQGTLAPAFLFTLLTCWGEMVAGVPKDSIGLQTSSKEIAYTTTIAENVLLLALNGLWTDAVGNRLPGEVISHLTLHIAQFPGLMPIPSVFEHGEDGRIQIPTFIMKKIEKLGQSVQDGDMSFDETKKLLAVVLHIYIREVFLSGVCALPPVALEDEPEVRSTLTYLVANVTKHALECVLTQVMHRLSLEDITKTPVEVSLVSDILKQMADSGLLDVKHSAEQGVRPSDSGESQLNDIIKSTIISDENAAIQLQELEATEFLSRVAEAVSMDSDREVSRPSVICEEEFRTVGVLIRKELGKMAKDMAHMFAGMALLHQQMYRETCPLVHKMMTFIVAILMELRKALAQDILSPAHTFDFLHAVAPDLCPARSRPLSRELENVVMKIVQDVEWKKEKSPYFGRIVRNLSKLSLEKQEKEEVAEAMASTAYMLSSVNPTILNQFVQTTLMSLLNSIRRLSKADEAERETLEDGTKGTEGEEGSGGGKGDRSGESMDRSDESFDSENRREDKLRDLREEREIEVQHEANMIAHVAIQGTLDNLGLGSGSEPDPGTASDLDHAAGSRHSLGRVPASLPEESDVGEIIVMDISSKTKAKPSELFTDLDPAMATYAQKLRDEVVKHMDSREGDDISYDEATSNDTVSSIIISNTFKSIEDGLQTGKFRLPTVVKGENEEEWTTSLSDYITTTLSAVREELGLVQKKMEYQEEADQAEMFLLSHKIEGPSGITRLDSIDDSEVIEKKKALQEEADRAELFESFDDSGFFTEDARRKSSAPSAAPMGTDPCLLQKAMKIVDFLIRRVSIDTTQIHPGEVKVEFQMTKSRRLSVTESTTKQTPSLDLSKTTVLDTFRDVLKDMHTQNQFFSPENVVKKVPSRSEVMPCLTYLLDEFVLNELQHITAMLTRDTFKAETQSDPLSEEAITVAVTFYDVIQEMLEPEASPKTAGDLRERIRGKFAVLHILSDAFKDILQKAGADLEPPEEALETKETTGPSEEEVPSSTAPKVSIPRTSSQTKDDLTKLLGSLTDVKETSKRRASTARSQSECVVQATCQILDAVQNHVVSDEGLDELYRIFLKGEKSLDTFEEKKQNLVEELNSLIESISDGTIPATRLELAAVELSALQKEHIEEPVKLAQAVKKVSFGMHNVGPEFLKVAVAELLKGVKDSPEAIESATAHQRERRNSIFGKPLSIDNRTISKLCVMDEGENREDSLKSIYSVHIQSCSSSVKEELEDFGARSYSRTASLEFDVSVVQDVIQASPNQAAGDRMTESMEKEGSVVETKEKQTAEGNEAEQAEQTKDQSPTRNEEYAAELIQQQSLSQSKKDVAEVPKEQSPTQSEEDAAELQKEQSTEKVDAIESLSDPPTRGGSESANTLSGFSLAQDSWEILLPQSALVTPGSSSTVMTLATRDSLIDSWASMDEDGILTAVSKLGERWTETPPMGGQSSEELRGKYDQTTGEKQEGLSAPPTPGVLSRDDLEGGHREEEGDWLSNQISMKEAKLQRTESEISKGSGSKASLEAANEDWNRSAVRVTRQSYASRIDEVRGYEESGSHIPPPILVKPVCQPPREQDPEKRIIYYQDPETRQVYYQDLEKKRLYYQDPETKKVYYLYPEKKRVYYQDPETKRVYYQDPETKKVNYQDPEKKRVCYQDPEKKRAHYHICQRHRHTKPTTVSANKTENACGDVSTSKVEHDERLKDLGTEEVKNEAPCEDHIADCEQGTTEEYIETKTNTRVDWESSASVCEYLNLAGPSGSALGDAELSRASLQMSQTQERTQTDNMVSLKRSSSILSHRRYSVSLQKPRKWDDSTRLDAFSGSRGFVSVHKTSSSTHRVGKLDNRSSRRTSRSTTEQELRVGLDPYRQPRTMPRQYNYQPLELKEERAQQRAFAAGRNIFNHNEKDKIRARQKESDLKIFYKAVAASLREMPPMTTPHQVPSQPPDVEDVLNMPLTSAEGTGTASRVGDRPALSGLVPHPPSVKRKVREGSNSIEELRLGCFPARFHAVPHPPSSDKKQTGVGKAEDISKKASVADTLVRTFSHTTESDIIKPKKVNTRKEKEKTILVGTTVPRRVRVCSPKGLKMETKFDDNGLAKGIYPRPPTGKGSDTSMQRGSAARVNVSSSAGRIIRPSSLTKTLSAKNMKEETSQSCSNLPRPPTAPRDILGAIARHRKSDFPLLADACPSGNSNTKLCNIEEPRSGIIEQSSMRGQSSCSGRASSRGVVRSRNSELSLAIEHSDVKRSSSQRQTRLSHPSTSDSHSWLTDSATGPHESKVQANTPTASGIQCQKVMGPKSQQAIGVATSIRGSSQSASVPAVAEYKFSSVDEDGVKILPHIAGKDGGSSRAHGRRGARRVLSKDRMCPTVLPGAIAPKPPASNSMVQ